MRRAVVVVAAGMKHKYRFDVYKTNVNPLNRLRPRILCVPRVNQYTRYHI